MADVHNIFASVVDGIVMNTFICENGPKADQLTRLAYGDRDGVEAVDISRFRVQINDLYKNGHFYRTDEETGEEVEIPYVPTEEQEIESLNWEVSVMVEQSIQTEYLMCQMELSML